MTQTTKGYILGAVAAVSYGTNPLFAVPLYELGMDVSSVLFYRYVFAAMILGAIMWMRGDSFRLERRDLPLMVILGIFFALSSVLLFEAYNYMDVGLASTLLFVEPVFIALILWFFYRERISLWTIISIAICLAGVAFLCNPGKGAHVTATGITLVIFSALAYGLYMVLINKPHPPSLRVDADILFAAVRTDSLCRTYGFLHGCAACPCRMAAVGLYNRHICHTDHRVADDGCHLNTVHRFCARCHTRCS